MSPKSSHIPQPSTGSLLHEEMKAPEGKDPGRALTWRRPFPWRVSLPLFPVRTCVLSPTQLATNLVLRVSAAQCTSAVNRAFTLGISVTSEKTTSCQGHVHGLKLPSWSPVTARGAASVIFLRLSLAASS